MKSIERSRWSWKRFESALENGCGELYQGDHTHQLTSGLAMGSAQPPFVEAIPHLVLKKSTGDERLAPKRRRRTTCFPKQMGQRHGCIEVDHRPSRSALNSARMTSVVATG